MKILLASLIGCYVAVLCRAQGDNPCASPEGRVDDLNRCLAYITSILLDTDRFFYGSSYEERCRDDDSIDCFNAFGTYDNSIASIVFENNPSLGDMDRFLYVNYSSERFEFEGCGTRVEYPPQMFALDMSLEPYEPALVRSMPSGIYWDVDDAEDEFYTLIFLDVGAGFLHGFYTNIPGNDIESGDVIFPYGPPLNFRFVPNQFVYLLFKQQNGNLRISNTWQSIISAGAFINQVPSFQSEYNLIGPVAVNILQTTTDVFAVSRIQEELPTAIQNCAAFVQRALMEMNFNYTLTGFLQVKFDSDDNEFMYCCESHRFRGRMIHADPIGNEPVNAADVETGSDIDMTLTVNGIFPNVEDWDGVKFVVVALDVDVRDPNIGTEDRPLLHYFAYNVEINPISEVAGTLMDGETLIEWVGPLPLERRPPHRYFFFVLAQRGGEFADEDAVDLDSYIGENCREDTRGRCLFDMYTFAMDNQLELISASWIRVSNDDFVNYVLEREESRETCGDRFPCPTEGPSGASMPLVSAFLMALGAIMALLNRY